jgi:hypothetical protein
VLSAETQLEDLDISAKHSSYILKKRFFGPKRGNSSLVNRW